MPATILLCPLVKCCLCEAVGRDGESKTFELVLPPVPAHSCTAVALFCWQRHQVDPKPALVMLLLISSSLAPSEHGGRRRSSALCADPICHDSLGSGRWVAKPRMGFEDMDREDLGSGLTSAPMEGQGC